METIDKVLSSLAYTTATISGLITLINYTLEKYSQKKKLELLKVKEFDRLLETSDIVKLGKYLDNEIGQMTISDYIDNNDINTRVNLFINKLTRFVGTEEQIKKEQTEQKDYEYSTDNEQNRFNEFPLKGKLGSEFDTILKEFYYGEAWNALSRLRRYIEITLRDLCVQNQIFAESIYSVTQLIDLLKRSRIISLEVARNLKISVYISNKAIHGQDISKGEAEEAIYHAAISLDEIFNK